MLAPNQNGADSQEEKGSEGHHAVCFWRLTVSSEGEIRNTTTSVWNFKGHWARKPDGVWKGFKCGKSGQTINLWVDKTMDQISLEEVCSWKKRSWMDQSTAFQTRNSATLCPLNRQRDAGLFSGLFLSVVIRRKLRWHTTRIKSEIERAN